MSDKTAREVIRAELRAMARAMSGEDMSDHESTSGWQYDRYRYGQTD